MPETLLIGLGTTGILYLTMNGIRREYRLIIAAGGAPMIIGFALYLWLLLFPGTDASIVRYGLTGLAVMGLLLVLIRHQPELHRSDLWLLVPLLLAVPVLWAVTADPSSFDPTNYRLIGRAFAETMSVREYPFVQPDRTIELFSWFAHPPILSLQFTFLHLCGVSSLIPYVTPFYLVLLFMISFQAVRCHSTTFNGILILLMLATTPMVVRTGVEGFATDLRLFFFAVTFLLLVESEGELSVWTGIVAGMALLTHTIGILVIPMAAFGRILMKRRIEWGGLMRFVLIALTVGGLPFAVVVWKYHGLAMASQLNEVFGKDLVDHVFAYQFVERGMGSGLDRLQFGYLSPFFRISDYGLSFVIGFLLLVVILIQGGWRKNAMIRAACGFIVVYLVLHAIPMHHNIFILSPRYILTILPVLLIAGFAYLPSRMNRFSIGIGFPVILAALFNLWWSNPFYKKTLYYGPMRDTVRNVLTPDDRVLVSQAPYFFFYHPDISAIDSMDPKLGGLYRSKDINDVLDKLKTLGITHLMMGYAPTPFDSDTFIRQLFRVPGLLEPMKQTDSHHLYRIHYPEETIYLDRSRLLFSWHADQDAFPVTPYDKNGQGHPVWVWYQSDGLRVFTANAGTKLGIARDIVWRKGAAFIFTGNSSSLEIRFYFRDVVRPFRLHWDLAEFDQNGEFLGTIHPRPVDIQNGEVILTYPTLHPRMMDTRIPLNSQTRSVALALSFYTDHGGMTIESFRFTGFE